MARKEINIGVEGNDGTGDSIRDSFSKVNDNFGELYAVLGLGGALSFIGLDDVEQNSYRTEDDNKILFVDADSEQIKFAKLDSNETIIIDQSVPGVIKFSSLASALINDPDPTLANDMDANNKRITSLAEAQLDDDAATKGYVDGKISLAGVDALDENGNIEPDWGTMSGPLILSRNPIDSDDVNYGGLIASTKSYVDSKTFISANNLYVATNGSDDRTDIPVSQQGRSPSTAFRSIAKAAAIAEQLVTSAPVELGPYQKTLTYNNGTQDCTLEALIQSPLSGSGATGTVEMKLDETIDIEIVSGGTAYEIGTELTLTGGIAVEPAVIRVVAKDFAGSITQVAIVNPGIYSTLPADITQVAHIVSTSGSGTATFNIKYAVARVLVTAGGSNYGSASVIFAGGGGAGAEASTVEIAGEIKEINVLREGTGYTGIPTVTIFLPRMLLETSGLGTDFTDDLREGQLLRGFDSNAIAKIISHDADIDAQGREIFEVELLQGTFQTGEVIQYGDPAQDVQITIQVETGIYYEHFPIRLAPNVSLRGDEFRRSIIRPKQGVSESIWSRVFFRRDTVIDGLTVTPYDFGYHYLTDPLDFSSQPKNNDEMDVFLCGDATIVRNVSVQGHGGFMMVLDPNNQINSKSPYCQTGSSFAKSINAKAFHGGQFVDGFVGNLDGILLYRDEETNPLTRNPEGGNPNKVIIGGLQREPQLPTSFNIGENIYRITLTNRIETAFFDAKVLLEQNRSFIQEEVLQWIATQNFTQFDEDKCRRDVGLIVDAVVHDVLYGGYEESTRAGRLYFSGGLTVVAGQVTETATSIDKAKEIAITVVRQNTWNALGTVAQTKIQSITGAELNGAEQVVINAFDIVANIIRYGEKMYTAKALLQANKEFIQADTIGYLAVNYPNLDYNVDTCFRDSGFIIDGLSIDLFGIAPNAGVSDLEQGYYNNSIRAGYSYYRAGKKLIPSEGDPQLVNQLPATIDAIEHIRSRAIEIISNQTPSGVFVGQTFDPTSVLDLVSNEFTITNHGFKTGNRLQYSNGGGTSIGLSGGTRLVNDGIYYAFVVDANRFKLYDTLDLVRAQERDPGSEFEIDFGVDTGTGSTHTLNYHIEQDLSLTSQDLTNAGITASINTATGYIKSLVAGDEAQAGQSYQALGDSTGIPNIYPLYECVLDTPYNELPGGKITLTTPGNKSMLGNDFTQVNDMGYGVFATNNGLVESVSMFTYYCYNAYYALNGAQIRSLNGSSAHGVYGLRSEGADPNEVPDRVSLKFPTIQIARVYEDRPIEFVNDKAGTRIFIDSVSYPPFPGCFIEVDHSNDPKVAGGTNTTVGNRFYKISAVSDSGLPDGVYECNIDQDFNEGGLAADIPAGKEVVVRVFEEYVIADKVQVVSTRPSTALVFDESAGIDDAVIRVLSFNGFTGTDAVQYDQVITTKDGFPYVNLNLKLADTSGFTPPTWANGLGDDSITVQSLDPVDAARLTKRSTGYVIYDGSSVSTGGMIFGYKDSIYEITGYDEVDILDGGTRVSGYGVVKFRNVTDSNETLVNRSYTITGATAATTITVTVSGTLDLRPGRQIRITSADNSNFNGLYYAGDVTSNTFVLYTDESLTTKADGSAFGAAATSGTVELFGGSTQAFEDSIEFLQLKAGLRAGAVGEVTVNISTMRATGHDFLDIGTGSYADTNYPSNIFGPPNNVPLQSNEAVEKGTGRVFWVSSDQSGNFRVGNFFAVDQGTGKVTLDAKIDLQGITSLRLAAGETVSEFTGDVTMGGAGEASNQALPTEAAIRGYIDRRLGLTHEGGEQTVLIGPGYLPLDGSLEMKGPITMRDERIKNLPDPEVGIEGEADAVRKAYMKMGNLQDAPEGWMYEARPDSDTLRRQPDYSYIESADILAFTSNGSSEFSNATVVGALTFTFQQNAAGVQDPITPTVTNYPDPQIVATINDNVIVNADVNYDAGIEQHKLKMNNARAIEPDGITITAYVYTAETSPGAGDDYTTITTDINHGITEGDAVVISGETVVTAINGDWKATNVTNNTFRIPADTSGGGSLSVNAVMRHYGLLGGANDLVFTLNNGYLDLKSSTNNKRSGAYYDGIGFEKLKHIDVTAIDLTDNQALATTNTRVLARRDTPGTPGQSIDGPPVPIDASTIVDDGLGCRRPDFPTVGVMVRQSAGNTAAAFGTIEFTSADTAETFVRRDTNGAASFAGTSGFENITADGSITINVSDGVLSGTPQEGLRMTYGASTTTVISKHENSAADNSYYTVVKDGSGAVSIKMQYSDVAADNFTQYLARTHEFRSAGGSAGIIDVGDGGLLTTGSETNSGEVQGVWSLRGSSQFKATWADLAEYYEGDKQYDRGTVMMFGGDKEVTVSNAEATTKVAGVVSEQAAYIMNNDCPGEKVCIALQGRVPCKVVGKIEKGDLIVSSSIPGVAMSVKDTATPGTIIGKAIEPYNDDRIGLIEVAVGRL